MASVDLRTGAESDVVVEEFDMPVRSGNSRSPAYVRQRISGDLCALTESFWLFAPNTHPVGRKIGFERFGEGTISLFSR